MDNERGEFMSILSIHAGSYYHIESLEGKRYSKYFDLLLRPEDLDSIDLEAFAVILVPCRTPAHRMIPHKKKLLAYLNQGGTIVATGESNSQLWLPKVKFSKQETNYWWWLEKESNLGIKVTKSEHSLFKYVSKEDLTWHLHGWFKAPKGAEILAVNSENKPILYIDEVTTKGRMIITSLDPFFHHGSRFMPSTTSFLDRFLPWIHDELVE